ncbi:hypothetical protein [Qipengyuania sp.]|uniref:hypothetical protein n=1 Tax=Qipengyuania sp. TaxID=2004515 RepID=UPI0035C82530
MTDHPSTYNATDTFREGVQWDDRASIHLADDGEGLLDGAKGLRSGTLADMIAQVMAYPEDERSKYVIEKAGDHRLTRGEIEALAAREDFPR